MHHTFTAPPTAMTSIALESEVLGNMVSSVANYFPAMHQHVQPLSSNVSALIGTIKKGLSRTENKISEELEKLDYVGHTRYMKIEVPEGFTGNMVAYLSELLIAFTYFRESTEPAMQDYYVLISSILTNKEAKKSLTDHTPEYTKLEKSRLALNSKINGMFQEKSSQAISTFGKHFGKNEELKEAHALAVALEKALAKADLDGVQDQTAKIADAMAILSEQAQEGKIAYLTAPVTKSLSQGAFEIARQVEFLSVNCYRAIGILKCLEGNQERFKRLI